MESKYILYKLPEGFIITSDEEIKSEDLVFENCQMGEANIQELHVCEFVNKVDGWIEFKEENCKTGLGWCKKVIAKQDQIDFSSLSEEEQKKIGWFDVENLANEYSQLNTIPNLQRQMAWISYFEGFQKAQELLSDRIIVPNENEQEQSISEIIDILGGFDKDRNRILNDFIVIKKRSQSQPKSWKVELETREYRLNSDGESIGFPDMSKPKLTNGKVKILKLL